LPSLALLRSQSDDRLVRLASEGHERAFEAIVERYRKPLQRECRRILPEARAEDAVQHAFFAAWTALRRGDEVRELRPWLHRIGHNAALNVARSPGYEYDELQESLRLADAPQDELERRIVMRRTFAGIAALPERQREALLRTALDGTSQEEIARDLGLSHGAVRQLVHRARLALRAAVTAVTPLPLAAWLAAASSRSEPMAQRIAELAAGGAGVGTATAAKVGVAVVVAGGAITGPAAIEDRDAPKRSADPPARADAARPARPHQPVNAAETVPIAAPASWEQADQGPPGGNDGPVTGAGDQRDARDRAEVRERREPERRDRGERDDEREYGDRGYREYEDDDDRDHEDREDRDDDQDRGDRDGRDDREDEDRGHESDEYEDDGRRTRGRGGVDEREGDGDPPRPVWFSDEGQSDPGDGDGEDASDERESDDHELDSEPTAVPVAPPPEEHDEEPEPSEDEDDGDSDD
jgi:RNA polymerase sigma factor (sigma-70 family)